MVTRLLQAAAVVGLPWLAFWHVIPRFVPLPAGLGITAVSPVMRDRHGEPLHHLVLHDFTRSDPVPLAEMPRDLIACTIAAEDKRFHRHGGIDFVATLRAGKDLVKNRRAVSGASTITQQLVKLASPPAGRTVRTKLREALLARHLEMKWTKDEILEAYLNRLPYGNGRHGPAEAARFYFQKPLADLSLAECALLAGLPQAPSRLNPLKHPQRALGRRAVVLDRLGPIHDASRISAARAEPLRLRPLRDRTVAPWLALVRDVPETPSTLSAPLQADLERIAAEELAKLRGSNVRHAAVVVLENRTREILALVSSGDWHDPDGGQINGALVPRSPGSALKPFTWLLAFEKSGLHSASIVADIPTRFRTAEGLDLPQNFDRTFRGPVSVRTALASSLNVPALRALNDLGGPQPLHALLLRLGMDSIGGDPAPYGLGLTLGNAPVRLLDLTNAYATLAEGGLHRTPRLWLEPAGTVPPSRLFRGTDAWMISDILSDSSAREPAFGRGGPLDLPFRCAAKTGTSSDFRDNWCIGYTADFTVGVWAGNFDNTPMKSVTGLTGAGPIFHRAIVRLHRDRQPRWVQIPDRLVEVAVHPVSGNCVHGSPSAMTVSLPTDRLPLFESPSDFSADGKLILDSSYQEWFRSAHNRRHHELALGDRPAENLLRILAPRDGATYVLDPELPNGGILHVASNLPGIAEWTSETLEVRPGGVEGLIRLAAGEHTITATDKRSGSRREARIRVISR